jgi:hypothetical protein
MYDITVLPVKSALLRYSLPYAPSKRKVIDFFPQKA